MSSAAFTQEDIERFERMNSRTAEPESQPMPPAPTFPEHILPPAMDEYVTSGARSLGVAVEMVAIPAIVFAGSTIGNRLQITLKRGYNQLPTLYAGIIAPPGSTKSPAQMVAQWPLHVLQQRAYDIWQFQRAEFEAELDRWQGKPKQERGQKPIAPVLEHLYTTDATMEALVEMLNRGQGIAIIRDELMGLVNSFDKYRGGKGSDRQEILSLWAGAPVKADRKSGDTVFASHPCAGIFGGIQPDRARGLHDPKGARDGFIERVLLAYPEVEPSEWTEDDLDPALLEPVVDIFASLRRIQKPDGDDTRASVHLSPEARLIWIEWFNENAKAIKATTGLRRGFYSKMPNQVARLTLVLSALWNHDDPLRLVSADRMNDAIAVGEFFRRHLDRVLPLIGDHSQGEPVGLNGRVLRILRSQATQENEGWVSRTLILRKLGNVSATQLTESLTQLFEQGRVESRRVEGETKPTEEWRETSPDSKDWNYSNYPSSEEPENTNSSNNSNGRVSNFRDYAGLTMLMISRSPLVTIFERALPDGKSCLHSRSLRLPAICRRATENRPAHQTREAPRQGAPRVPLAPATGGHAGSRNQLGHPRAGPQGRSGPKRPHGHVARGARTLAGVAPGMRSCVRRIPCRVGAGDLARVR